MIDAFFTLKIFLFTAFSLKNARFTRSNSTFHDVFHLPKKSREERSFEKLSRLLVQLSDKRKCDFKWKFYTFFFLLFFFFFFPFKNHIYQHYFIFHSSLLRILRISTLSDKSLIHGFLCFGNDYSDE